MTTWTEVVMAHLTPWPIGVLISASAVSFVIGLGGVWALWRVRRLLKTVPAMNERVETLSNSVSLLTDTTEACFKALSMQLQFMRPTVENVAAGAVASRQRAQAPVAADRQTMDRNAAKARQRRVVGAAKRGEAVAAIAAREDLAETEVALRLHVNREQPAPETKRYGTLFS